MTIVSERLILDVVLIHISGRATLTEGAEQLADALQRLIDQGQAKFVIDLGDVPYIDSTALGAILRGRATVSRRGGALKLLRVRGHVRELLELTKLLPVFEVFDSDAEALASFESPPSQV